MDRKLRGQKLMIVHLHRKKKKCFFRINTDSGITCQAVCTDSHSPVGGVGHIRLSVLPLGSGRPELPTPQESLRPGLSGLAMAVILKRLILWVVIVWVRTLPTAERASIRLACGISMPWEAEGLYTGVFSFSFLQENRKWIQKGVQTGASMKNNSHYYIYSTWKLLKSCRKSKYRYRYIMNSVKSGNVKILTAYLKNT